MTHRLIFGTFRSNITDIPMRTEIFRSERPVTAFVRGLVYDPGFVSIETVRDSTRETELVVNAQITLVLAQLAQQLEKAGIQKDKQKVTRSGRRQMKYVVPVKTGNSLPIAV